MRKVLQETKSVERIEVSCDDCGYLMTYRSHTCCMCHKDLCEACYHTWEGTGDYPPVYCKDCLDIGKPYIDDMNKLEKEYEEKCELLTNEWQKKCSERRANILAYRVQFQEFTNH